MLTQDGTAEPVSRDQILRHERGQGNIHFPCSAHHEQDPQPYLVDPYAVVCDDHIYMRPDSHTLLANNCFVSLFFGDVASSEYYAMDHCRFPFLYVRCTFPSGWCFLHCFYHGLDFDCIVKVM